MSNFSGSFRNVQSVSKLQAPCLVYHVQLKFPKALRFASGKFVPVSPQKGRNDGLFITDKVLV